VGAGNFSRLAPIMSFDIKEEASFPMSRRRGQVTQQLAPVVELFSVITWNGLGSGRDQSGRERNSVLLRLRGENHIRGMAEPLCPTTHRTLPDYSLVAR
jgi:hypothetical protein